MDRNELSERLAAYQSKYEEETKYKKSMLNLLKHATDCFERTCLTGHFTGSAWIINQDRNKVLLVHHKMLNRWLQPGGHADGEENLFNVAKKEAREETGIRNFIHIEDDILDLDIHLIPRHKNIPAHYHFDVRILMLADDKEDIVANEESNQVKWLKLSDIVPLTDANQSILRMVHKTMMLNH